MINRRTGVARRNIFASAECTFIQVNKCAVRHVNLTKLARIPSFPRLPENLSRKSLVKAEGRYFPRTRHEPLVFTTDKKDNLATTAVGRSNRTQWNSLFRREYHGRTRAT